MTTPLPQSCAAADAWLVDLACDTGDAPADARRHVEECQRCADELRALSSMRTAAASLPMLEPSDELDRKLLAAVDEEIQRIESDRHEASVRVTSERPALVVPLFRRRWFAPLSVAAAMAILVGLQLLEGPGFARFNGEPEETATVPSLAKVEVVGKPVEAIEAVPERPEREAEAAYAVDVEASPQARGTLPGETQLSETQPGNPLSPPVVSKKGEVARVAPSRKASVPTAPAPSVPAAAPVPSADAVAADSRPSAKARAMPGALDRSEAPSLRALRGAPSDAASSENLRRSGEARMEPQAESAVAPRAFAVVIDGFDDAVDVDVDAVEPDDPDAAGSAGSAGRAAMDEGVAGAATLLADARVAHMQGELHRALPLYREVTTSSGATDDEFREAVLGEVRILLELKQFAHAARRAEAATNRFPSLAPTLDELLTAHGASAPSAPTAAPASVR